MHWPYGNIEESYIMLHLLSRQFSSSKILKLGQNLSYLDSTDMHRTELCGYTV